MNYRGLCVCSALLVSAACSVALAQWSAPIAVTRGETATAHLPAIAVDSSGTLHASWSSEFSGGAEVIKYSCKPANADTWTIPIPVSRDSVPLRRSAIGIGPDQKPYVVWGSEDQAGSIYISHREADTWTIPERLTGWNGWGSGLRGKGDHFGRIHVVWWQLDYHHIWYARYDETGWSQPESIVNDTTLYACAGPYVATDRQGFAHVVYVTDDYHRDSIGYVRQTSSGWTLPVYLPCSSAEPRIALDSSDRPLVVASDYAHNYTPEYCYWTGDSWSSLERLDTLRGYWPGLCVDIWNRVHVLEASNLLGMRELTKENGVWRPQVPVDSHAGYGEPLASGGQLHLLWKQVGPATDLWYSYRTLDPPGIADESDLERPRTADVSPMPVNVRTQIEFYVASRQRTNVEIVDSSGRVVGREELGILQVGRHAFGPYRHLPGPGVFVCRIRTGSSTKTVKLVRVN